MLKKVALLLEIGLCFAAPAHCLALEWVRVAADGQGFVLAESQRPFRVWGVNYDHDARGRLLEDYWQDEWPTVEANFAEIKTLGANTVRIHLQFGRFMQSAARPDPLALAQLARLLALAEQTDLYLDLTGLGCYHKAEVPEWYDRLSEAERWASQAVFWQGIAETCAGSPAVFCYDLMNEPVVPGEGRREDWLGPAFAGKHFVQFVTLDLAGRQRTKIARQWIAALSSAIRKHDARHLITVGLVDWSLDRPGLTSGFVPREIGSDLDFVAVHLYPQSGKLDAAAETLRAFQIGKPLLVEETFPLRCSAAELARFIEENHRRTAGWISFYWGQTAGESRARNSIAGSLTATWLEQFSRMSTEQKRPGMRPSSSN